MTVASDTDCSVEGCDRPGEARGWCSMHYARWYRLGTVHLQSPADLFWAKVRKTDGCWPWTGLVERGGYGRLRWRRRMAMAHRVAYELSTGPIPEGFELDHTCHTAAAARGACAGGDECPHRACVNPAHLEPVTHRTNGLRGVSFAAENATKTHCLRGHEYTPENTYMWGGHRSCRECRSIRRAMAS